MHRGNQQSFRKLNSELNFPFRSDQPDILAKFRGKILDYQVTRGKFVKKGPTNLGFLLRTPMPRGSQKNSRKLNSEVNFPCRSDQPDILAIFRGKILDGQVTQVKFVKQGPPDLGFYCALPCIVGVRKVLESSIRNSTFRVEVTNLIF